MPFDPHRLYTRHQAAKVLGISVAAFQGVLDAGAVPVREVPGFTHPRIAGQAIIDWIQDSRPATNVVRFEDKRFMCDAGSR